MKREPNLFEAFRDASAKAVEKSTVPTPASDAPRPGPGFGGQRRLVALSVLCIALVFCLGYLTGEGSGEVVAKTGVADSTSGVPATEPGSDPQPVDSDPVNWQAPGKSADSDLSSLYNPQNLYTVLAITYTDVPSLQGHAKKISEYLRSQGLPAFEPVSRAGNIEILVGAAGTNGALKVIEAKLRGTRGPNGSSYDFQSAFVVNIDNHLDRD